MSNIENKTDSAKTQTFFNGYFTQPIQISETVYQQVYNFFLTKMQDSSAASSLTQAVLTLTYNNNLNPLDVISDFGKASGSSDLKQLLIAFFNATKGSTSKLGYQNNQNISTFAKRNIVA
jgi:hypothetical protein